MIPSNAGLALARNTAWNLAGHILPLVVALFAIPILTANLGIHRFGVLALAWMVIGYFSLFDLGLGRVLTKLVSEKLGAGETTQILPTVQTALLLMLVLGMAGMVIVALISPWLVHSALRVPEYLRKETLCSFYLLSVSIPIVILTSGLRGALEAYQRFRAINIVRGVLGAFSFLGPLLLLPFSHSLVPVVAVLFAGRMVALLIHLYLCSEALPGPASLLSFERALVRPLLSFGSWITVSNVVGPLMVYLDRFLIGAVVSMAAVAYYVTPYEVVTKLWVIPGALGAALFPAFAAHLSGNRLRILQVYLSGVKALFLTMLPICLLIVTFAQEGLKLWLGAEFASHSTSVLQWLTVGVLLNSIAQVPYALIQSAGRADVTAKLHLVELPLYLVMLWVMLAAFGIVGAAVTWVVRVAIDALLLFWVVKGMFLEAADSSPAVFAVSGALFLLLAGSLLNGLWLKFMFVIFSCGLFLVTSWRFVLSPAERGYLLQAAKARL